MARRINQSIWFAAALLVLASDGARAEPEQVNTIQEAIARIGSCWKPPAVSEANPIDITVIVSFNRAGEILGRPRITYESEQATDNDRLHYRVAVMEALQRCAPMPFTESMAGAVAGRPFAVRFRNRKLPPQPTEKRAWLTPKIL
ncbi:MAG: hypothetical protein QOJ04_641 [Caballeronia sp.]|nr:hypothetical protein [Caballeronia sp.]